MYIYIYICMYIYIYMYIYTCICYIRLYNYQNNYCMFFMAVCLLLYLLYIICDKKLLFMMCHSYLSRLVFRHISLNCGEGLFGAMALTQFCKLLFGLSKGMLHVEHLTPRILMAVDYCGC